MQGSRFENGKLMRKNSRKLACRSGNKNNYFCVCLAVTLITGQPEMQDDYVIDGGKLACSINYGGWRSQFM
jgi:hypothetical protein